MATYTTAGLIEAEIRASTAFSSSTTPTLASVNTWIEQESARLEIMAGEVFSSTVVASQYLDYDSVDKVLRLPRAPILSVEEVRYNIYGESISPSWVTLEEGRGYNYLVYLDEGEVEFISGNSATHQILPKSGKKKLCVSYTHGYTSTPPEIQRLATLMVAKRVIMTLVNSQGNSEGGEIQVGTIRVSDPSNYSTSYLKQMNEEISEGLKSVGRGFQTYRLNRVYD